MYKKVQILFSSATNSDEIHPYFREEAIAFSKAGFIVSTTPCEDAECIIYRGVSIKNENQYPKSEKCINSWQQCKYTTLLSCYYQLIEDITIPTFFWENLDNTVIPEIVKRGWNKVFIKNDIYSLMYVNEHYSVWPDNTFDKMVAEFNKSGYRGLYAIRKYMLPDLFLKEDRYWVLNGEIYYRNNNIPDIVREAVRRLNVLGSKYYVIDATPDFIVEVNPGESADRCGENSVEMFARWFKEAFILK